MRFNNLDFRPLNFSDADDQLRLPFDDPGNQPPTDQSPITSVHKVDVADRYGRSYEVVVHQSPDSGIVLAYCLRPTRLN